MGTLHLNYIIQTQLSKLTTTDSQKNRTTPQSNAHYETILPKMKHSAIILVQFFWNDELFTKQHHTSWIS